MLIFSGLATKRVSHKKIVGSYVESICHIYERKMEKVMKLPLAYRAVTLEQGRNCSVSGCLR